MCRKVDELGEMENWPMQLSIMKPRKLKAAVEVMQEDFHWMNSQGFVIIHYIFFNRHCTFCLMELN